VHQQVVENTVDKVDDYNASLQDMDGTENELLNHIKSRKVRYFGHVMRQPRDNVEGSVMVVLWLWRQVGLPAAAQPTSKSDMAV